MFPRVTAVLVVHRGGDRLRRTLAAVRAQHRAPDELIIVLTDADTAARDDAAAAAPNHIVSLSTRVSFGEAVRAAEGVLTPPSGDDDALWLLAEDSEPAADTLARLVATLETERSVAIAGPKLMSWDAPDRIVGLGRSITRFGRAVDLVADELDQGQHDELSDVLGVGAAGLLVRHAVWRALDGFDPGLPVVDDALDFSIRARLAGHRVSVVPSARVVVGEGGVAGPEAGRGRRARRRRRLERAAELHRRLVYAPAAMVPLHWLALLPLAVARSIGLLLTKAPGAIGGEFAAAFQAMFGLGQVAHARRTLRRAKLVGWSAIAPLRIQPDEMRRRRRAAAEARRARARGRTEELQFLGTGGGWVLLGSIVVSAALMSWLFSAAGIGGGALLPLSDRLDELWRNAAYGWRDVSAGFVGPADPFAGVLAVLGSITFWSPSFALVALWVVAIPVAALGAWFTASRLTERGSLRALAAAVWALAPPFVIALADGRPGAVIAHALLGWLAFAAIGAASSWASTAAAGLLLAVVVAAAPSLAPALILAWIVAIAISGRSAARYALIPLPALVLAAPLIWAQVSAGTPLGLLADPGLPAPGAVPGAWWLALGFPVADAGWSAALEPLGLGLDPVWIVTVLLAPLVLLAVSSLLWPRLRAAILALATALAGFATAVAAAHLAVASIGDEAVPVWSGAGQSLAWLGLVAAVVIGLDGIRRGAPALAAVAGVAAAAAVLPAGLALATSAAPVGPAGERTLPAFVVAAAETDPRVTTLRMEPLDGGGLRSWLEHGTGATLDDQSTIDATRAGLSEREARLAELTGNLASQSGFDAAAAVDEFGTTFVLLAPPESAENREAVATAERARAALDGNPELIPVGDTAFGVLWRFADAPSPAPASAIPANAGGATSVLWTTLQLIVLGAAVLLSIPTGAGREDARVRIRPAKPPKPPKPAKPPRARSRRGDGASGAADADTATAEASATDPVAEASAAGTSASEPPAAEASGIVEAGPPPAETGETGAPARVAPGGEPGDPAGDAEFDQRKGPEHAG
ncbi:glycosyltransferase family 2 protein [Agromyces aerolatus]|uniref:glycosyltransferase family 2 protein n=1 Tax=Agromyces sp. LY-1074 TaxID=3074080 RepID=UPI0028637D9A|nr:MULTISPECIES: glycosyltransferase [unclassified Agromyces]MDR5700396.1 glycosyltransferase [Agromyces sp. LY-1074]MDR5706626.1 glycosyltransferase [Agromyces sp. LY-1358]